MRNTRTFEIEGYKKTFLVKELKVKEIISLMNEDDLNDTSLDTLKRIFSEKFLPMCSNIELEDLEEMTPSEIEQIWDEFKEANKSFFGLAQKMGLEQMLQKLKEGILVDFSRSVVNLSSRDIQES